MILVVLTTVGESAFRDCKNLRSVTLSSSITEIADRTFYGCTALEEIVIHENITVIGISAFDKRSALKSVNLNETLDYSNLSGHTLDVNGDGKFNGKDALVLKIMLAA